MFVSEEPMKINTEAEALAHLRRESLDIYNRLHSIDEDVAFVNHVHSVFPEFALIRTSLNVYDGACCELNVCVANLRCGAWYTDPQLASSSYS